MHHFFRRHVYSASRGHMSRPLATTITFFISALAHELVMGCITRKFRGYGFIAMMLQMPIVLVQRSKWVKGRTILNNVLFWCSMILGLAMVSSRQRNAHGETDFGRCVLSMFLCKLLAPAFDDGPAFEQQKHSVSSAQNCQDLVTIICSAIWLDTPLVALDPIRLSIVCVVDMHLSNLQLSCIREASLRAELGGMFYGRPLSAHYVQTEHLSHRLGTAHSQSRLKWDAALRETLGWPFVPQRLGMLAQGCHLGMLGMTCAPCRVSGSLRCAREMAMQSKRGQASFVRASTTPDSDPMLPRITHSLTPAV